MAHRSPSPKRIVPDHSLLDPGRSIVIVTSEKPASQLIERYLIGRKWNVKIVVGSLSQGLQVASIYNATYLFISTDLIPTDSYELYKALKKCFEVIIFSSRPDAHSLKMRAHLGPRKVCIAPLTGPLVERLVLERGHIHRRTLKKTIPAENNAYLTDVTRLATSAGRALSEICMPNPFEKPQGLGKCGKFHCFAISTTKLSGYLVVATSGSLDGNLTERLREEICKQMSMSEDFFRAGEIQEITLEDVQFEGLALGYGEFFKKATHVTDEIAISLFRVADTDIEIDDSHAKEWVSTRLQEFISGAPINFDIYLYLGANRKFLLYRRAGQSILETDVKKLESRGVNHVHLKRESIPQLRIYKTSSYLSSLVSTFRQDSTDITSF